jgi:hypothetical protein
MYTTSSPSLPILSLIERSKESKTVKTEIIAKIPIVIPNNERNVLSLFVINELKANIKLSLSNLIKSIDYKSSNLYL